MKKNINGIFLMLTGLAVFTACSDDWGTTPGTDATPNVTIYQYDAPEGYDEENDITVRLVGNQQTSEIYYFAEKTADKDARELSDDAYADFVVNNGTKASVSENNLPEGIIAETVITGLAGEWTVSAVAVGNGQKKLSTIEYSTLPWNTLATGTYIANVNASVQNLFANAFGSNQVTVQLQQLETDPHQYRLKNLWGRKQSLLFNVCTGEDGNAITGEDEDGVYTFLRIPQQATPFTFGNYGTVGVRDVGLWQGDDSWVTEKGYESGIYEDNSVFFMIQYFVSAGNVGYGYDYFIPGE
ncbi:MAG: hypothetical protein IJ196_03225 [Prevotella sp.]|nr:hypothetical protein [Prevotella sp.]